jgi:biotin carboxyl carrier protein
MRIEHQDTLGVFLNKLEELTGIQVEWVPYPGHPESVEYLKDRGISWGGGTRTVNETVQQRVEWIEGEVEKANSGHDVVNFRWVDDMHLQVVVSPEYERVLVMREVEEKQEEERAALEAKQAKEREAFYKLFMEKYSPKTRVYPLKVLTPVTAKTMIEKELREYFLTSKGDILYANLDRVKSEPTWTVREEGEFDAIVEHSGASYDWEHLFGKPGPLETGARVMKETAVADEKANALLVTAVPETQERVAALLQKLEGMASEERPMSEEEPHRLSVVLLQGGDSEKPVIVENRQWTIRAPDLGEKIGTVKSIHVKEREVVKEGQVLMEIDLTKEASAALRRNLPGYAVKMQEVTYLTEEVKNKKAMFEAGRIPKAEVDKAQLALDKAELELQAMRKDVPEGPYPIRADGAATILKSWKKEGEQVEGDETLFWVAENPRFYSAELARTYGLNPEDLEAFGFDGVLERGKSVVTLVPETGRLGTARARLDDRYMADLEYLDERPPYLIVRGSLTDTEAQPEKTILENTLYLKPGEPGILGVTNLKEALILVVERTGEAKSESAPRP